MEIKRSEIAKITGMNRTRFSRRSFFTRPKNVTLKKIGEMIRKKQAIIFDFSMPYFIGNVLAMEMSKADHFRMQLDPSFKQKPHFNLYARSNNEEFLMTKMLLAVGC